MHLACPGRRRTCVLTVAAGAAQRAAQAACLDWVAYGATGLDSSKDGSPPHGFFGPPWNFLGGLCRQSY
eukprot:COSAG03_NODE_23968_length_275_cov_8.448864_1_plen_68_part_10